MQPPVTISFDRSLRPETTYLVFDNLNNYGPIDIRVADNYTGNQPSQIHLSLAGANSYWVMWATGQGKIGTGYLQPNNPNSVASIVQYGFSADKLEFSATGDAEVYDQIYINFDPNKAGLASTPQATNYTSPILHSTKLQNLVPGKNYYYRVGDGVTFSQIYNFTCVAAKGATYPQRLLLVADWGLSLNSTTTLYHLQRSLELSPSATALLNIGDLSYADDRDTNGKYFQTADGVWIYNGNEGFTSKSFQPVWDAWLRFIQPLVATVPMLATLGNHEIEQQNGVLSNFLVSYQSRFKNAASASSSRSFQYYSVDVGPVHNILLSSYADYTVGSAQYNWLLNDLLSIDRTKTPWVTASTHHPWYTTDTSFKEFDQMRQAMEPLLYQYGVDVFFNGHVHSYERINPVYDYKVNKCGLVHITIGDGGNQEGLSGLNYQASSNGADPLAHLYQDTLNGCPTRSTNSAVNDAARINSTNPRAYRPTGMTPLDGNSNGAFPLNSSYDPWSYYQLSPTYQGDGNTTGATVQQRATNPKGYCWAEQPPWSAYRESSFGHGTLDVINATHALWHWLRNQDSEDGPLAVVTDPIYIFRDPSCTNKQGVPQPPAPVPETPPASKAPGKLQKIIADLAGLKKDSLGFQQLQAADPSEAVLPVQADHGSEGTTLAALADSTEAAASTGPFNTYNPADQGQDTSENRAH
ncbi:hypothetical protein WJX75_009307 [Coccomyxa subellipsoidea]|uniref:Purple acid phosphatase n=1 Tax=Coccomyxa subellipsoidea TaxID=248742 RepID=A0ABR2Z101_9CHLO